jgi:hypothetical protein
MVFDEIDAGHRRRDRARRRRDAAAARRARAGDHDHAPAADRERRRPHFRVEKVAGDPTHTRIEPLDDAPARDELERMPRRPRSSSPRSSEPDRAHRHRAPRQADEGARPAAAPDDIASIDHTDLDRVSAEELVESGVASSSTSRRRSPGRSPNPRPAAARPRRCRLIDVEDRRPLRRALRRRAPDRPAGRASSERHLPRHRPRARGAELAARCRAAGPRHRGARGVRRQHDALPARGGRLLAEGIDFPPLETRFRDRHALVVARGPGHKRDLQIVRPYVRDFKPVLVGVDGGADALLEAG